MPYPQPDDGILREWEAITAALAENLPIDVALLRRADSGSLEVLAVTPVDGAHGVGDRQPCDDSHFCDELLTIGDTLLVADTGEDPQWSAMAEARDGYRAYCGTTLHWPDGEAYGTLSVLCRDPLDSDTAGRVQRLLRALATGAAVQLALLVRREEGKYEETHDALTGLPNQQLFNDLATMQTNVSQRNSAALWIVIWSIDPFNDEAEARGRDAANALLQRVAERARACIRQSDVLARVGDNQFACLIAGANEFVANAVADRLRRNLSRLTTRPEGGERVTVSCGLTPYAAQESLDAWLDRARVAMRDAHADGGDRAMIVDPDG